MKDKNSKFDEIEKLQNIPLTEISEKTHLEKEYIEALLKRDFEKFKDKNLKAYIKILEREFDLNLDSILKEYEAFVGEPKEDVSPTIKPAIIKSLNLIPAKKSRLYWIVVALITVILLWMIFYFKLYERVGFADKLFNKSEEPTTYSTQEVVERVENKLEDVGIVVPKVEEEPEDANESNITAAALSDELDGLNALDRAIVMEQNKSIDNIDENESKEEEMANEEEPAATFLEATIIPKEDLWIGIIELRSGKKTTKITDEPFKFDLTKEQLVLTGHGNYDLEIGDEKISSQSKSSTRFLIHNSTMKKISYSEFLKLNSGKAW